MIRHRYLDIICIILILLAMVFTSIAMASYSIYDNKVVAVSVTNKTDFKYMDTLFDDSYVHRIDIIIDDISWSYITKNAEDEIYVSCSLVVDGKKMDNVAIRPKGNSSLSAVKAMGTNKFSWKLDFDHYTVNQTFDGLDKLVLNNLGQDTSCMKDYLAYHMMNYMGIASPLSSYTYVTLNGEDLGLYLAVEAIEDSFVKRNYGLDYGCIYKPDSLAMDNLNFSAILDDEYALEQLKDILTGEKYSNLSPSERIDIIGDVVSILLPTMGIKMDDAMLKYLGDDLKNYEMIFKSSVFDLDRESKKRFVQAVKLLNTGENPEDALYIDSIVKYFVVHNFVDNYDGYTSPFVHNFYLHEKDGKFSMIPWDYNLGFGAFNFKAIFESIAGPSPKFQLYPDTGKSMSIEKSMVNYPIDTPVFSCNMEDRPLLNIPFKNEKYLKLYHEYFLKFIIEFFDSGYFADVFDLAFNNIAPYVEKGGTSYTLEQFNHGTSELKKFCNLRAKSVKGQLDNSIPSTLEGQIEKYEALIDSYDLNLSYTINFSDIIAGLGVNMDEVTDLLIDISGADSDKNLKGLIDAIESMEEDEALAISKAMEVIKSNKMVQNIIKSLLSSFFILLSSIIFLLFALRYVIKYPRNRKVHFIKRGDV